jgi:hypothetical protein
MIREARTVQSRCGVDGCSGCFRVERSPGGSCTHWKAPPHGAHVKRTLRTAAVGVAVRRWRAYKGCEGSPGVRPFNTSRVSALRLAFDRAAAVARLRTSPTPERPAQAPQAAGAEPRREAGRVQPIGAPATLTGGRARCAAPQSVTSMSAE